MIIQNKYSLNSIREFLVLSIIAFVFPFTAFFTSLLFYKKSWSKYLFVFFCTYFGYTFIIPSSKLLDSPFDSEFYANVLLDYYNTQISFQNFLNGLFTIETSQTDLYQPFVTWILSRFTDNYHILFAIFGFFFGWFYTKILWFILDKINFNFTFFSFALILMVLLLNPLWNINGVRMWTGLEVYLYGVILYFHSSKRTGYFYMILSVIFHFSFIIPIVFFLIYSLIPKKKIEVIFYLYLISLLITNLPIEVLFNSYHFFPDFIANRIITYTSYETVINVSEKNQNTSFFIKAALFSIKLVSLIFLMISFKHYKKNHVTLYETKKFLFFILFTFVWTNIFSIVPSGGRFLTFSYIVLLIFVLLNLGNVQFSNNIVKYKNIILPLFFVYIIYSIRTSMDFQGLPLIFGNFINSNLFFESTPYINFFK